VPYIKLGSPTSIRQAKIHYSDAPMVLQNLSICQQSTIRLLGKFLNIQTDLWLRYGFGRENACIRRGSHLASILLSSLLFVTD
jgi:hypothetical protein